MTGARDARAAHERADQAHQALRYVPGEELPEWLVTWSQQGWRPVGRPDDVGRLPSGDVVLRVALEPGDGAAAEPARCLIASWTAHPAVRFDG